MINTVLGKVPLNELGWVRMHEHVLLGFPGSNLDPLAPFDREHALTSAVQQLLELKVRGVSTIVDATPIGMGRDPGFLARAAEATGLKIVASTGFFTRRAGFPDYFARLDIDGLAEIMEVEITRGMDQTSIKAGVIKVATGPDKIFKSEERVLRASARVHKRTLVPIITHTESANAALMQLKVFQEEGVRLSSVVIGHICCYPDISCHLSIMKCGAFAGFDRIGWEYYQTDEVRTAALVGLVGAGYSKRLVLSQDSYTVVMGRPDFILPNEQHRPITYLDDSFLPGLGRAGVSSGVIEEIFVKNPQRIFGRLG